MKPELLVITPVYRPALDELAKEFVVHKLWEAENRNALRARVAPAIRGVVTTGAHGFTREDIDGLPQLEIVAAFGRGHASMDMNAARERGVIVTNTPDRTVQSTADVAMALMLALMRRVCAGDRFVRAGSWGREDVVLGRDVGEKLCGIVGLGHIGSAVGKRAAAFDMAIAYHGPREKRDVAYRYYASLEELARDADCLVVSCLLTPDTRGLIDARVLDALGPEGFLVNVARGPIVDEQALINALQQKKIAGAALDVYWDEPHVPEALRTLDNVVLTPHIGTMTLDNREERTRILLEALRAHFASEPPLYRVRP